MPGSVEDEEDDDDDEEDSEDEDEDEARAMASVAENQLRIKEVISVMTDMHLTSVEITDLSPNSPTEQTSVICSLRKPSQR